jgi:N6-adenosine-specific RNA methylase IME4
MNTTEITPPQHHPAAPKENAASQEFEAYGKLKEDVHLTGYTFERACQTLEWLLDEERWQRVGAFSNVHEFMDSVSLDKFRPQAEARARIAKRIKELEPKVSNRAIAKTLGVSHTQVATDIAGKKLPASPEKLSQNNAPKNDDGNLLPPTAPTPSSPPRAISGAAAANLVHRREVGAAERKQRVTEDEQRILNLRPVAGKFRTIVLDPAWEYDWLSIAGRAKPGYAMQTHEQLLALDVRAWADEESGCHLYCWVTNNFMAQACELVKHWGFQHRTKITWIKPPPFGLGSYFRNSTEDVLFATLGKTTTRPAAASISTHFEAPRGETHSEKPERFYEIVRASSYPPYSEGNQRKVRPDFTNLYCPVTEGEAPADASPPTPPFAA